MKGMVGRTPPLARAFVLVNSCRAGTLDVDWGSVNVGSLLFLPWCTVYKFRPEHLQAIEASIFDPLKISCYRCACVDPYDLTKDSVLTDPEMLM